MTRSKSKLSPSFAWLLLLALAASQPALALQVVDARDSETVLAKVSRKGGDAHLRRAGPHPQGDGQRRRTRAGEGRREGPGLHPAGPPDSTKPINLFVSTERSTIGLLLQPVDTPATPS